MQSTEINVVYMTDGFKDISAYNMYRIKEELASEAMPVFRQSCIAHHDVTNILT